MSNFEPRIIQPKDQRSEVIRRAMGVPIPSPVGFLLGTQRFADVYNLSGDNFRPRVFYGLSIVNPSSAANIIVSLGPEFGQQRDIVCPPNQFFTFDHLTFGPGIIDDTTGNRCLAVRARLDIDDGVAASATIDYSGSGNPTDGMLFNVGGKIFEFSNDLSKDPGNHALVVIGATADDTWTYFVSVLNNTVQGVFATINTGTDLITITSNYGGAYGNGLVVADGAVPTGAVVSGNLSGGSGGLAAIFHIW